MPAVIADAGPLIGLSRIGRLALLREVFEQILITPAVAAELRISGHNSERVAYDGQEALAEALVEGWLRLSEPANPGDYRPLNPGVDAGEASCIALALSLRQRGLASLLILDDRAGRAEARRLDLELTGTAAVVAMARLRGLIPAAGPVLHDLRGNGYFLSEATIDTVQPALNER